MKHLIAICDYCMIYTDWITFKVFICFYHVILCRTFHLCTIYCGVFHFISWILVIRLMNCKGLCNENTFMWVGTYALCLDGAET